MIFILFYYQFDGRIYKILKSWMLKFVEKKNLSGKNCKVMKVER